nr:unnamed protein product [Callosobruchus analis]
MNVPESKTLPGQNKPSPHVIIGDEAFALKLYVLKHFPYKQGKTDILKENLQKNGAYSSDQSKRKLRPAFLL